MDDSKIIELFYERSEQAIVELSKKYGRLCQRLSHNIVKNEEVTNNKKIKDTKVSLHIFIKKVL